jgi:HEAT repeat protein
MSWLNKGGSFMSRWLPILLLAIGLGALYYFAWPALFPPGSRKEETALKGSPRYPGKKEAEPLHPVIKELADELATGGDQPSPVSRQKIQALAKLGPKGPLPVPLVEAWLQRMQKAKLGDTPEFRELAQALLAKDPTAPQRLVTELNRQDVVIDRGYQAWALLAFRTNSLSAMIDGLKTNEGPAAEADSALPLLLATFGADAIRDLREALNNPNPTVRRQAIRTLALMGPEKAGPTLAELASAVKDQDGAVRTLAALALGELADRQKPAPAELNAALEDPDALVRLAAARSLTRFTDCDNQRVATVLIALLKKGDFSQVAWTLGAFGASMLSYAESKGGIFYDPLYWEETAAHLLIQLGPRYQLPPDVLVGMLKECPHDGRHLVHMLMIQREAARNVVPDLAAMVKDKDSRQRRKALLALGRLGLPVVEGALPEIRAALDHADGRTRWRAFLTLALLEPATVKLKLPASLHAAVDAAASSPTHPRLDKVDMWTRCIWQHHAAILQPATSEGADAFRRSEPWTLSDEEVWTEGERVTALLALADKAGPHGTLGVPFLLAAWQAYDRNLSERKRYGDKTLGLLAREGTKAEAAVPALVNALYWHDPGDLTGALVQIGEPAVPILAQALDNPDNQDIHLGIMAALQEFGPKAQPALPALMRMLTSPDENLAQQASHTIGSVGSAAVDAVPLLQKLIMSPSNDARRHAVDALGLMGPPAKAALPMLIGLFKEDNQQLRVVAVRAVGRIGKDAVDPLAKALEEGNEQVRLSALHALARLGPDASPALPVLHRLEGNDQPPAIRQAAQELVNSLKTQKE